MIAIEIREPGGPDVLVAVERPTPVPAAGEVLIKVAAAGVNRPGRVAAARPLSAAAGRVRHSGPRGRRHRSTQVGAGVSDWRVGDAVCALVAGGGYAEYCVAPAPQCLPVPRGLDLSSRRRIPGNVLHRLDQRLRARTAAGRRVAARPRRLERHRHDGDPACARRSARACSRPPDRRRSARPASGSAPSARINYREADFVAAVRELTGGRGVDVVLDMVGGEYFARNLDVLAMDGRLVQIATLQRRQGRAQHPDDHAAAADHHRLDAAGAAGRGQRRHCRAPSTSTSGRCSNPAPSSRSSTRRFRCATRPRRTA